MSNTIEMNIIYILDDSRTHLIMAEQIITFSGIGKAVCFDNSTSFYEAFETQLPDIILLDINMPDVNGIDVCINLKSQARTKDIPVIFISAHSGTEMIVKGFKAGAVDYISKPFIQNEIIARITTHIKLKKGNEELKFTNEKLQNTTEELQAINEELNSTNEELQTTAYALKESNEDLLKANVELKINNKYTDNLIKSIPDTLIVIDENGKIKTVNQALLNMLKYEEKDVINQDIGKVFAAAAAAAAVKNIILDKTLRDYMVEYQTVTGETIPVALSGSAMHDENDNVIAVVLIGRDMRQQIKMQAELRESESKIKSILNNTRDVIWSMSWPDLNVLFISPSVEILYERPVQDFYDDPLIWQKVTHPDDKDITDKALEQLVKNGSAERECRIITPGGNVKWVYDKSKIIYDESNNPVRVDGTVQDITKRKNAEKALQESEKKFHALYMNMIEGAVLHELTYDKQNIPNDYIIIETNKAFEKQLGISRDSVIGKTSRQAYKVNEPPYFDIYARTALTGEPAVFETHFPPMNKYFSISVYSPYKNSFATIFEDITERKQLQQQLIQSEKLSAVGQLAAGIAHEFNNVLAIIYNNAQMFEMVDKINLTDETTEFINTIKYAAKRGGDIATNMMSFAKPLSPKKELTNIENIIEETLNMQKHQLALEHIEIERDYRHMEKVLIDGGQFQQVFLNMIINARHAIQPKRKGKISISVMTVGKNIEVKIMDDGVGINNEDLTKIFTPFFSTKGAHAKDMHGIQGTGLGLAVSYTIIKNHNGTVKVESEKGKWTAFTIELPIPEKPVEVIEKKIDKEAADKIENITLNVLVVDDEPAIISSMTRMFKINNCTVSSSMSGIDGVKLAKENKFDIIFLDMLLPDISGEAMFAEIRKFDKDTPIVFISGQVGMEADSLKEMGAHAFIQKPFDMEDVNKILNEIRKKKTV